MAEGGGSRVPDIIRVITFFDGQNFFNQAKRAFGSTWPDYDPIKLSEFYVSNYPRDRLAQVRFYTGVPPVSKDREKAFFWRNKIAAHSKDARFLGITRELRYHIEKVVVKGADGMASTQDIEVPREKGIDVRIALDLVEMAFKDFDKAVIFSQDNDLLEAVNDLLRKRNELGKWLMLFSAFCLNPAVPQPYRIGLQKTAFYPIDETIYKSCVDSNDYRPSPLTSTGKLF